METPNWADIRQGQLNMAELIWTYHQALLASGFDEERAVYFATMYQDKLLTLTLLMPQMTAEEEE